MPAFVRRSIFLAFQNPETVSLRSEVQNLARFAKVKRFSGLLDFVCPLFVFSHCGSMKGASDSKKHEPASTPGQKGCEGSRLSWGMRRPSERTLRPVVLRLCQRSQRSLHQVAQGGRGRRLPHRFVGLRSWRRAGPSVRRSRRTNPRRPERFPRRRSRRRAEPPRKR